MIKTFFAFIFSLITLTTVAQTISIQGRLRDANDEPIAYATLNLMDAEAKKAVAGAQSADNGNFSIPISKKGVYYITINTLGYESYIGSKIRINQLDSSIAVGTIKLTTQTKNLKIVEVKAEKSMMQMDIDKRVFNVEKNTTTSGGSAADVLQNVPSVAVDLDGNVSLRGKGNVTILIDGRPSTMLGSDVASALQSLSASSIESVEVITNPSSKYDAQGMSGIINIITKRDKKFGLNGVGTLGIGTLKKYNGSLNLNLKI